MKRQTSNSIKSFRVDKRAKPLSPSSGTELDGTRPVRSSYEVRVAEHLLSDDNRPEQVVDWDTTVVSPDDNRPANAQVGTSKSARKRARALGHATGCDKVSAPLRPDQTGLRTATEADPALNNVLSALRGYKGEQKQYPVPAFFKGQQPTVICRLSQRMDIHIGCIFHGSDCGHKTAECNVIRQWIVAARAGTLRIAAEGAIPESKPPCTSKNTSCDQGVQTEGLTVTPPSQVDCHSQTEDQPFLVGQGTQTDYRPFAVHRSCQTSKPTVAHQERQAGRPLRLPLVLKPETRSIGIQEDIRYHIGSADLPDRDEEVPVVTLLSQGRGQAFVQEIDGPVDITRPQKPSKENPFPNLEVYLDYFDPAHYWPGYKGPTTCLLAEAYEPVKTPVEITEVASIEGGQATPDCFTYQSPTAQREAGFIPTSAYSASALITQLDDFLEDRDGEEDGPEGYHLPLKKELQQRLRGYLDTTR